PVAHATCSPYSRSPSSLLPLSGSTGEDYTSAWGTVSASTTKTPHRPASEDSAHGAAEHRRPVPTGPSGDRRSELAKSTRGIYTGVEREVRCPRHSSGPGHRLFPAACLPRRRLSLQGGHAPRSQASRRSHQPGRHL